MKKSINTIKTWQPSRFVRVCVVLHLLAFAALLIIPSQWIWVLIFLFVLHGVIATVGLWPRSTWLGTNIRRLPEDAAARGEIAITIDDGPDPEVTPQVLDILRAHGAVATFFCIGERAQAHPELCTAIISAGCAVENHGLRHRKHTSLFGPRGWRREVEQAQILLEGLTGQRPYFFRPIAGLRNPFLDPLLQRLGVQLVSWTRRGYDTRRADSDLIYQRLTRDLASGDILLLHDGNAARTASGKPIILEVLPRLLDELARRNLKTVTLRQVCPSPQLRKPFTYAHSIEKTSA